MAVTTQQIAYAVRLIPNVTDTVDPSVSQEITRLSSVIDQLISVYSPLAPEAIKDEAKIMFIAYIFESLNDQEVPRYPDAFRNSGCIEFLSYWASPIVGITGEVSSDGTTVNVDGLSQSQILSLIALWARAGNTDPIPADKLTNAPSSPGMGGGGISAGDKAILDKAVQIASITLSGRTVSFVSDDGTPNTISLPGVTIKHNGTVVGTANQATQINFTGTGVSVARVGADYNVTITAGTGGGGGLTIAQVNAAIASNQNIVDLREFESALRVKTNIIKDSNVRVTQGNRAYAFSTNPSLPEAQADRSIIVSITAVSLAEDATFRFDLSSLRAKRAATTIQQLSSTNAVQYTSSGVLFSIGYTVGGHFLFSADTIGDYVVSITDDHIDILDLARTKTVFDTAVKALVSNWAEQGNTDIIPINKVPPAIASLHGLINSHSGAITTVNPPQIAPFHDQLLGTALQQPTAPIDLDDRMNQYGEFHYSFVMTVVSPIFVGNVRSTDRTSVFRTQGIIFASDLRDSTAYTGFSNTGDKSNQGGIHMLRDGRPLSVPFSPEGGGSIVGNDQRFNVLLAKDAQNRIGWYMLYSSGSGGPALQHPYVSINATLDLDWLPADTNRTDLSNPVRLLGLQNLKRGAGTGLSVTSPSSTRKSNLTLIGSAPAPVQEPAPTPNLNYSYGEFHYGIQLDLDIGGNPDLAFGTHPTVGPMIGRTAPFPLRVNFQGTVFASTLGLRPTPAVSAQPSTTQGLLAQTVYVWKSVRSTSPVRVGALSLYFAKSPSNQAGYFLNWSPDTGATGVVQFTVTTPSFTIDYLPADPQETPSSPLLASLVITGSSDATIAANARPSASWQIASGNTGYTRGISGQLRVPKALPEGQRGLIITVEQGGNANTGGGLLNPYTGTEYTRLYIPWEPALVGGPGFGTSRTARYTSGAVNLVYVINASSTSAARRLKVNLQRDFGSGSDSIIIYGNGDLYQFQTIVKLYKWED